MEFWFGAFDATARLLGLVLLHFIWQGALVGAVYGLMRNRLKAGRERYALGLVAFGILMVAPLATGVWLQYDAHDVAASATAAVTAAAAGPSLAVNADLGSIGAWQDLLPWIVALWGVGVAVLTCRALLHWRDLSRLIKRGSTMPAWQSQLESLCAKFGVSRAVRLLYSADVQTPTLVGWIKPVILLPAAVALGFPAAQIELILAHELGHLRRWDHVVNLVQVVVETVLFYHPVVHWISRDLRNQREICCDELVLETSRANPRDYVETLADLEQLRLYGHGDLAVTATGGVLLERVQHIAKIPPTTLGLRVPGRLLPIFVVGIAVLWMGVSQRAEWDRAVFASIFSPQQLRGLFHSSAIDVQSPELAIGDLVADRRALRLPQIVAPAVVEPVVVEQVPADVAAAPVEPVAMTRVPETAPAASADDAPLNLALAPAIAAPAVAELGTTLREVATAAPAAATAAPAIAEPAVEPVPVHVSQPSYPTSALLRGVEGHVKLSFVLDAGGQVRDVKIERSTPANVFDGAAILAMRKWRFDPASYSVSGTRYTRNFVFSLGGKTPAGVDPGIEEVPAANDCRLVTGTRICRRAGEVTAGEAQTAAPN
jgi:TonB family protein